MKSALKIFFPLVLLVLCSLPANAGMKEDVEYLSHALLGGRGVGSTGSVEASWYIMRRFKAAGLQTGIDFLVTPSGIGHNITGIHKGNPKSDTYVLVMAHYDGLGTYNDELYPGADSNASGTAMLLSLADSLAGSKSNYIFAALDCHDSSLLGAEALARKDYKLSMVVNIDIIGSILAPPNKYRLDFLIVLGGEKFEKNNSKQFDKLNEGPGLRIYYDYYKSKGFTDYFYNTASDQAPFLRKGIPAAMFTSGITMNTNKPTDTWDTLDYEIMERRRAFILNWLSTL